MTLPHLLRTLLVAAAAAVAVMLASQARAEGGEESIYAVLSRHNAALEAEAPPAPEPAEAMPIEEPARRPGLRQRAAAAELRNASAYQPLVARFSSEHGIPFALADAVVQIESRYNAGARNGPHLGLMQINARTAQSLGYQGTASGLLDPETNLRYGVRYLAEAYRLADGDTCGTILRYQGGHRAQAMTAQAQGYCARVKTLVAKAN